MNSQKMYNAYIEAVFFTDTGDTDQPSSNQELTPYFTSKAHIDCSNFLRAITGIGIEFDYEQLGHDLWLTRNGHGTGFWDRPEIYGKQLSDFFTRISYAMGSHDSEFELN